MNYPSAIVSTNLMHLNLLSKMVGLCETRKEEVVLKILKDEKENAASGDWLMEICVKKGVLIKDDLPSLKAVCDKIEELDNKHDVLPNLLQVKKVLILWRSDKEILAASVVKMAFHHSKISFVVVYESM